MAPSLQNASKKAAVGCLAALLLIGVLALKPFTIIDAGSSGVLVRFGKVSDTILPEGFHLINPLDNVVQLSIQTQRYEATSSAASKDLQSVSAEIVVNGHLDPDNVNQLYQDIGINYESKIVDPAIQESVKAATAQFTAEELITKRQAVGDMILKTLSERLSKSYIIVESVSIVDFSFSEAFNQAIEAKVTAEQNALAAKNKLEQIKYEAEQRVAQAQGEAEAIRIQAESISAQGGDAYVTLQWIEQWDGVLPTTMLGQDSSVFVNPLK